MKKARLVAAAWAMQSSARSRHAESGARSLSLPTSRKSRGACCPVLQLQVRHYGDVGSLTGAVRQSLSALEDSGVGSEEEEQWRVELDSSALEVELLSSTYLDTEGGTTGTQEDTSPRPHRRDGNMACCSTAATAAEEVVQTLDTYARAAITNYISRVTGQRTSKKPPAPRGHSSTDPATPAQAGEEGGLYDVVIREVEGNSSSGSSGDGARAAASHGVLQYHARQRLPLPEDYGVRFAEGFGSSEKEAETLAAMHAVRILDALGFPVYQLSSKQRKHAEAARAAGRHAPLPGDSPQPPSTPTPLPLRYQAEGTVAAMERRLRVDQVDFAVVTTGGSVGAFTPFQHTLASPYFLDYGSVRRVTQFFAAYRADIQQYSKVTALHKAENEGRRKRPSGSTPEPATFLAQLRLPIMPRFGDRVCMGKAHTTKDAIALACMHAELTIDALGLALYPTDSSRQLAHVEECRKVGRACAAPGDLNYHYSIPSPPPLQLVTDAEAADVIGRQSPMGTTPSGGGAAASRLTSPHGSGATLTAAFTAEVRRGATTVESVLVQHSRAVREMSRVVEVSHLDETAKVLYHMYAEQCAKERGPQEPVLSSFFVEVLGIKFHETYRATVTVPLLFPHNGSDEAAALDAQSQSRHAEESFVAIGISSQSAAEAELAAATHAIRALAAMNHPIAFTEEAASLLSGFAVSTAAGPGGLPLHDPRRPRAEPRDMANTSGPRAALMLPVRCVCETHLGRILAPGLAGNKEHRDYRVRPHALSSSERSPPPVKPGDSRRTTLSTSQQPVKLQESELLAAIVENRRKLPREDWSLTEDADHRIIVAPSATATVGRNYVHTLSAVRTPDVFAVNRLKDYLERHGKRLSACIDHTLSDVGEGDGDVRGKLGLPASAARTALADAGNAPLQLHRVTCVLPTRTRAVAAMAIDGVDATPARHGDEMSREGAEADEQGQEGATATAAARVVAQGEAYTMEEAVLMCAMHAELLLDALGIAFYDHPDLQRRHADTARMLGRWAPIGKGAVPPLLHGVGEGNGEPVAPVPPPLRKEHAQSCLWARLEVHRRGRGQNTMQVPAATDANQGAEANGSPKVAHTSTTPVREGEDTVGQPRAPTPAAAETLSDDDLCDLSRLQAIHHSEIFRMALRHIQVYFHSRGSDFYRSVRQYTTPSAQHGTVYRAIAELPVPARFGRRFAVGCASNKKRALSLCATHAAWTLEALGIPIYTGKRQLEYAKASELRGRSAPRPGDPMKPPDTPSPMGLCCFVGGSLERPEAPAEPTLDDLNADSRVWPIYVRSCRTFIEKTRAADLQEALFELHQAPRSGIDVEDDALDLVERAPVNTHAKHTLLAACAKAGLPAPSLPFRYQVHGRAPQKRFLVETPVLGTPYTARGVGKNPAESLARTAMHYEYLVTQVVSRNGGDVGSKGATRFTAAHAPSPSLPAVPTASTVSAHNALYDVTWGQYTVAGQEAAIALYCSIKPPFTRMTVSQRKAAQQVQPGLHGDAETSRGAVASTTAAEATTFTARVEEEAGSLVQVTSRACEEPNEAMTDVVRRLFTQLQSRARFQSVAHFVRKHPQLRLGAIAAMQPPGPSGVAAAKAGTNRESAALSLVSRAVASQVDGRGETPPASLASRLLHPEEVLRSLAGLPLRAGLEVPKADAFLSSHMAELLLDMAQRQLDMVAPGQRESFIAVAPMLTLSAAARDALPVMGLLQRTTLPSTAGSNAGAVVVDAQESWRVTPLGVAAALLLQALPPRPTLLPTTSPDGDESAAVLAVGPLLPLQLAKLLLAGLRTGCLDAACRVAALVVCGNTWGPRGEAAPMSPLAQLQTWASEDLVERALSQDRASASEAEAVREYEAALKARLWSLSQTVQRAAPSSTLAQAFARSQQWLQPDSATAAAPARAEGDSDKSRDVMGRRKLRLGIAFATFPELWVVRPTGGLVDPAHGGTSGAAEAATAAAATVFDSRDGLRSALMMLSTGLSSPCLAAFDAVVVQQHRLANRSGGEGRTPQQHYGHVRLLGTRVSPAASLVATVPGCNTIDVLSVDEDNAVDRIALFYQATVAVPMRSQETVQALQAFQQAVGQALEPLTPLADSDPLMQALLALSEAPVEPVSYYHLLSSSPSAVLRAYVEKLAV